jgi:UDP-GlcNAc:undecaprenyl-phosphate GlcNAc-1-phosphate transferase
VGRPDRLGAVLVSLYSGPLTWALLAAGFATTVALTFILPRVQRPGAPLAG